MLVVLLMLVVFPAVERAGRGMEGKGGGERGRASIDIGESQRLADRKEDIYIPGVDRTELGLARLSRK